MINNEDNEDFAEEIGAGGEETPAEDNGTPAEDNGASGGDVPGELNYEPIIGSYEHDDMFEQLIREARQRSEEKARISAEKAAAEDEEIFIAGDGETDEEDFAEDDEPQDEGAPEIMVSETPAKKQGRGLAQRIKDSEVLKPEVIKDMFFGSERGDGEHDIKFTPDGEASEVSDEDDIEDPVALDRRTRKRKLADPNKEKVIFSIEYMLTPDQALDGYMLFYNEFVKKKNIKLTLILGVLALVFLFSVIVSPKGYINYMLLLITLSIIALRWLNSSGAKRDAVMSAEEVKNDSYRLDFYNSRILLKASEFTGDKIYTYPPVMIRFEDIDLKVLDYEEIYVLIFKKSYVYTVPKSAMTEEQNRVFGGLLESILGDDYCEFYSRVRVAEEKAERRRQKRMTNQATAEDNGGEEQEDFAEFDGGDDDFEDE